MAVVDDELCDIRAVEVGGEGRVRDSGAGEDRGAARGTGGETPGEGERIAIDVGRAAAVELDERTDVDRLVRAGVSYRGRVLRADIYGGRSAVGVAVVHDELGDIGTGLIDGK